MTQYWKKDRIHIKEASPRVQLEGTETDAKNLSLRENAGQIDIYDEVGAATVKAFRADSLIGDKASGSVTIPIGGGSAPVNITLANLDSIVYLCAIKITLADPDVADIYTPRGPVVTDNIVGMTLAAGTGTTLTAEVEALGH